MLSGTDLVGPLGLCVVVQELSLNRRADDGETLPCFQLIGQRQQAGLLDVLLGVHAHQDQDLRPDQSEVGQSPSIVSVLNRDADTFYFLLV